MFSLLLNCNLVLLFLVNLTLSSWYDVYMRAFFKSLKEIVYVIIFDVQYIVKFLLFHEVFNKFIYWCFHYPRKLLLCSWKPLECFHIFIISFWIEQTQQSFGFAFLEFDFTCINLVNSFTQLFNLIDVAHKAVLDCDEIRLLTHLLHKLRF